MRLYCSQAQTAENTCPRGSAAEQKYRMRVLSLRRLSLDKSLGIAKNNGKRIGELESQSGSVRLRAKETTL